MFCVCPTVVYGAPGPTSTDLTIAKGALIMARNRLAKDRQDATGHLLLSLSRQLHPENDDLLLTPKGKDYDSISNKALDGD